ncbi:LOW QUALITY PROTEIN: uncharacterized protein LOC135587008 [Musa acuminata AAA Group]|uniref:LOW QUALITY PROTEIN: uncharacterized protein LOC135587008 n=1 Tax=Musa acuminata AAA Group TaxID=214697 RepID=UPI0031D70E9E
MREGRPAWLLIPGVALLLFLSSLEEGSGQLTEPSFSRADFPLDFDFGAGTSSYQVEGAVSEDGRKPSIWDTYTHAGRMLDKSTGDVASDGYHKYKEDVKLMAETGLDSYRFSISWSRLIPNGRGAVNPKGLQFYNNLIDELVKYGIKPHVSLYHLDHPQALEDKYSGWLSPKMVDDFTAFADVCFKNFGDRVPRWTTIVEPNIMSLGAYDMGTLPPNRCSYPFGINCTVGNSTTEPYIAIHNVLLAHASIVKLYKSKYQVSHLPSSLCIIHYFTTSTLILYIPFIQVEQNGWIGINVYTFWYYPFTNSSADIEATQRILEFYVGWILNPLVFGDYPEVMKKFVGSRLPSFTKSQSEQIKGLFDFIGVNHYSSIYVKDNINASEMGLRDFVMDSLALVTSSRNATPGQYDPMAPSTFDPRGLQYMLEYLRDAYGNPPLFVEENGYGIGRRESDDLNDTDRINYLNGFIGSTLDAIRNGANVKGYFVWSFIDVFEFLTGYQSRCGLYHVDFDDKNRKRKPKLSAGWYSKLLERKDGMKLNKTAMDTEYHARCPLPPPPPPHLRALRRLEREEMREGLLILGVVLLLFLSSLAEGSGQLTEPSFSRADFPSDFIFGAGTSSYQVEGAVSEDGRKPSIWDTFTHAGRMLDKSTGDVASDGYHKYKEDVKLMAETGLDSYRFSISWSRLIPNGRGAVNPKGLQFYNNLIDELVKYGIKPHVSLYHLDHPQALEDEYSGWLSPKMVDDFTAFADVCFKNFGDRVPRWTTVVEPNIMSLGAYDVGILPPNRCSYPFGINCTIGNSTTEPYIVVHNVLLAHASIVKLYKSKYQVSHLPFSLCVPPFDYINVDFIQAEQNGFIGINVYTFWYYPLTNSSADIEATQRMLEFYVGWILNPLVFGDYPEVMKKIVGSRLPSFTKSQSKQIKGLFDFIGVNHYSSVYVKDNINASEMGLRDFAMDSLALMITSRNETPGQYDPTAPSSFDPQGLQYMLEYLRDAYGNPPLFVEENGYGIGRRESGLNDTDRINYLNGFIGSMLDAIRNGANVKGYFVWSFIDVFEFLTGYQSRLGLYHVDFDDENRKRKPKLSAGWYSKLLERKDGMKLNKTAMDTEYHARW